MKPDTVLGTRVYLAQKKAGRRLLLTLKKAGRVVYRCRLQKESFLSVL